MIPSDPKRRIIDPRRLVREHGRDALAELVARESGYIFQLRPLKDLCQALRSGMPLLAEGERGGERRKWLTLSPTPAIVPTSSYREWTASNSTTFFSSGTSKDR